MIKIQQFKEIALSFSGAEELPHFEKASFRVGKKIFATVDEKNNRACLKLSLSEQDVFSLYDKTVIYPVPNKWGQQGWTFVELAKVKKQVLKAVLASAYGLVASGILTIGVKKKANKK